MYICIGNNILWYTCIKMLNKKHVKHITRETIMRQQIWHIDPPHCIRNVSSSMNSWGELTPRQSLFNKIGPPNLMCYFNF